MAGREYVSRFSLTVDPEEQRRRDAIAQGIVQNELQVATDAGDARSADYLQQELRNRFSGKTGGTPTFSEATPVEPAQSPQPSGRWEVVDAGWEKRSTTTKSTDRWEDVSSQFMYAGPQAAQPSPDNSFMGSVARGLKKTIPELKQAGAGVVAYLGDVLGSDGMREWGLDKYQKIEAETKPLQSENDSFSKVFLDGEGSKTAWLGNAVGYTLGQVGTALVSGGIGALGGKFLAKKAITEGVERAIATRLEQELAAGAARDVAEQAALKAGQEYTAGAIAQGVKTGAITGAFTHNVTQELGGIYTDAVEQAKKEGRSRLDGGDLFRIGASALAAAGVDTAAEAVNFGKVFKGGVGETIGARAAREIPAGMVREGATEAVQTGIEQYGAAKPFDRSEIIDAAALGAVGGGMAGGAASLRQAPTASQVPIDQAADAPITPVVTPDKLLALPSPSMPAGNGVMVQGKDGVRPQTFGEVTAREEARIAADQAAAERQRLGLGEAQRIQDRAVPEQGPTDSPSSYVVADPINGDGPETVRLIKHSSGAVAIIRQDGDLIDISNMIKAGFSPERAIAASIGEDVSGKNVQTVSPNLSAQQTTTSTADVATPAAPIIGSDAKNGFQHGPDGTRYRTGIVSATGGVMLDVRYRNGGAGSFYVGVDGNMVDADSVNLVGDGASKIWKPTNEAQSTKVQELLRERAQLGLTDPKRKTLLAAIREIVTNTQPNSAPILSANGQPFTTEKAALLSIKAKRLDATVVPVNGGFGIQPKASNATNVSAESRVQSTGRADLPAGDRQNLSDGGQRLPAGDNAGAVPAKPDAPASARPAGAVSAARPVEALTPAKPAKPKKPRKEPTLIAAIKAAGGLRSEFARDLTGETPRRANQMYPFAFRRDGVDLSTMVHNGLLDDFLPPHLRSEVFNAPDAPANPDEAIAYIEDAIRNGEAASMRSWDTQMALAQDAMTERQLESVADEISDEMSQAEIEHEIAVLAATNKELNEVANAEADQYAEQQIYDFGETAQAQSEDSSGDPGARTGDAQDQGRASEVERPSLELTGQTENQIRGEEARRARQQADQRARDNAPSPDDFTLTGSDRAADVGAARGQNSLFEPQSEYGQRDLFADEVPDNQRANLVERVGSARSDGIDAKTAVNRAEQRTLPGRYATGVKLEPGAVRDSAVASVRNLQDAALATSSLSSLVREHVDVVVTDRAGKILAVQRMFGGATSQASAYPQEIIKFVTAIKGSSAFYVAHNHPSDNYTLSDADRRLSNAIGGLAKGIAPEYRGIVSVTTRGYAGYSADGVDESGPFREAAKKHRIRYLEETVEKRGYLGPVINAPEIAKTVVPEIAQGQQGIVFLDAQYHPTGFFPVNFEDATKLLDGELARDIVAAAYRSRASAAMMATQDYAPGPYVSFATSARDGVRNVGALLARIEVRALDAINSRGASRALVGDTLVGDTLFARANPTDAVEPPFSRADTPLSNAVIKAVVPHINGFYFKAFATPAEAGGYLGFRIPQDARGVQIGRLIVLIEKNIPDQATAEFVLWHELLHVGIMATHPRYGKEYQRLISDLINRNPNLARESANWRANYGEETVANSIKNGLTREQAEQRMQMLSVEEALADLAGQNVQINGIKNFIAKVQQLLRAMGFENLANWMEGKTDAEALAVILQTRDALTQEGAQFITNGIDEAVGQRASQATRDDTTFSRAEPAPLWRSVLTEAIGKAPFQQSPAPQWKAWLQSNAAKLGVKKDEIEWSGITDWLDLQQGKVSREQVQQYLAQNGVKVTETEFGSKLSGAEIVKNGPQDYDVVDGNGNVVESGFMARQSAQEFIDSESKGDTKYSSYTLPGGENYRELLLTLPPKEKIRIETFEQYTQRQYGKSPDEMSDRLRYVAEQHYKETGDMAPIPVNAYKSSHWDQPNILAHIRFNERTDADGKRVLFLEEIQGDWQQEYRKQADAIAKAVDDDFLGIVKRMEADGVLEVVCD